MTEKAPYLEDRGGRRFPLAAPVTLLGRSPECHVFIADRRASRRHAEIRREGEACVLRDREAANGVFLNDCRIGAPHALRDGDEIAIASAVFTFRDPEATWRMAEFPLLVVDAASGQIWVNRKSVSLSPKEQALFDLLYRNAGQVLGKREIARAVWPEYRTEARNYQVESLVKRLREKLEPDPRHPALILTVPGHGYRLVSAG